MRITSRQPNNAGGFPACRPPAGEAWQTGGPWHSLILRMMVKTKSDNKETHCDN
jgi:hypothetical protein